MNFSAPQQASNARLERFVELWKSLGGSYEPPSDLLTPYPGLRSFDPGMEDYFCARDLQKESLRRFMFGENDTSNDGQRRLVFVVGGSGSGKSSLVRAGLLPVLKKQPIAKSGAFYFTEMKPGGSPAESLLLALENVGQTNFGHLPKQSRDNAYAKVREHLSSNRGNFSAAVFDFVGKCLNALDMEDTDGVRAGEPYLVLHIDQFEEVFRSAEDGRQGLLALLRDVHDYRPERLFVIATMRSEEIHRLSEHQRMAEVLSSSMYLIDLVDSKDIRSAIVDPARRFASRWNLPIHELSQDQQTPFSDAVLGSLREAYDEAGRAVSHKADKLPLLQHLLPLLWRVGIDDWIGKGDITARLSIDAKHLARVTGWSDFDPLRHRSRLGNCLDRAADNAFLKGKEAFLSKKETTIGVGALRMEATGILEAAFCSLAGLDDRGGAVRKLVTIDQMLSDSGGFERLAVNAVNQQDLHDRLEEGLKPFLRDGLVQTRTGAAAETQYDVCHESFIRNWTTYGGFDPQHKELGTSQGQERGWLTDKRLLARRLQDLASEPREVGRESWLDRVLKTRQQSAAKLIMPESRKLLGKVFAPHGTYSTAWAMQAIGGGNQVTVEGIKSVWTEAGNWDRQTWDKKIAQVFPQALPLAAIMILGLLAFAFMQATKISKQADQLRLALATNDMLIGSEVRSAVHDRALASLSQTIRKYIPLSLSEDQEKTLNDTVATLDKGVRNLFGSEIVIQRLRNATQISGMNSKPANCEPAGTPLVIKLADTGATLDAVEDLGAAGNFSGMMQAVAGGWICVSYDGRWVISIDATGAPQAMQRIVWIASQAYTLDPRRAKSYESQVIVRGRPPIKIAGSDSFGGPQVEYFQWRAITGFKVSDGTDKLVAWTSTGLADPDDTASRAFGPSDSCDFRSVLARGGGTVMECLKGVKLDRPGKYLSVIRAENCVDCGSTIEIRYGSMTASPEERIKDRVRTVIRHRWKGNFTHVAVDRNWIRLRDEGGKQWRYAVGAEPLEEILNLRWKHTKSTREDNHNGTEIVLPETCAAVPECKLAVETRTEDWPGVTHEKK